MINNIDERGIWYGTSDVQVIGKCINKINEIIDHLNSVESKQTKIVDIEDCIILGYNWSELKRIVDFAKMKGYEEEIRDEKIK